MRKLRKQRISKIKFWISLKSFKVHFGYLDKDCGLLKIDLVINKGYYKHIALNQTHGIVPLVQ